MEENAKVKQAGSNWPCQTCGLNVYGLDHDGGCPQRLGARQVIDDGVKLIMVWDGTQPDRFGGYTKGELLNPFYGLGRK